MSEDGYRPFSDEPPEYSRPVPPPTYGTPLPPPAAASGAQPGQFGFSVPLQVGYAGYNHTVNVPVAVDAAQFGAGGQFAAQQLSMGSAGHLQKGAWSDGLCACKNSILISVFVCCCPCIRWGITINRAFPEIGFVRPCTMWFILYAVFGALWLLGYAVLPSGWLWIPAAIIAFPFIAYTAWYRTKLRAKYAILGTLVTDFAVDFFCLLCAMCQEARHVDRDHGIPV